MLAVTFLALLAGAGIRATPSVLIVPLEQEFGWSRSAISFAISVNILLYGLMGPFAGAGDGRREVRVCRRLRLSSFSTTEAQRTQRILSGSPHPSTHIHHEANDTMSTKPPHTTHKSRCF